MADLCELLWCLLNHLVLIIYWLCLIELLIVVLLVGFLQNWLLRTVVLFILLMLILMIVLSLATFYQLLNRIVLLNVLLHKLMVICGAWNCSCCVICCTRWSVSHDSIKVALGCWSLHKYGLRSRHIWDHFSWCQDAFESRSWGCLT